MGEDRRVPALGVSCIHLLNVDSAISTSTEERSQCCISSNTWNAASRRPNWREQLRRQMGLRDRRTLREWRVVRASSTHESHQSLGFSAIIERRETNAEMRNEKRENVRWKECRKVLWLVGSVWGCWFWCELSHVCCSAHHITLTSNITFKLHCSFFLIFPKSHFSHYLLIKQ